MRMLDAIRHILASDFMPHGACYFWEPWLVWLHVISDSVIALAYAAIPAALIYFAIGRHDVDAPYRWMFTRFGVFIVACGATHVMEVWNIWHSNYLLAGAIKALTAFASVPTAFLLVRLIPEAVAAPSPAQLAEANQKLHSEIEARKLTEETLARHVEELDHVNKKLVEAERIKIEFAKDHPQQLCQIAQDDYRVTRFFETDRRSDSATTGAHRGHFTHSFHLVGFRPFDGSQTFARNFSMWGIRIMGPDRSVPV
jgi:hypothetical protein